MKSIIIVAILLCIAISTKAQSNPINIGTSLSDTIAVMKHLEKRKSEFIGKPLAIFLKEYESHLPIEFMGTVETSPWIHPQGKSYVSGIIISYKDEMSQLEDSTEDNIWNFLIEFQNPHMSHSTF